MTRKTLTVVGCEYEDEITKFNIIYFRLWTGFKKDVFQYSLSLYKKPEKKIMPKNDEEKICNWILFCKPYRENDIRKMRRESTIQHRKWHICRATSKALGWKGERGEGRERREGRGVRKRKGLQIAREGERRLRGEEGRKYTQGKGKDKTLRKQK